MLYQRLTNEIDNAVKNAMSSEPEVIRKMANGEIPMGAGIDNQYFSTFTFALIYTLVLGEHVVYHIIDLLDNSKMPIESIKEVLVTFLAHGFSSSSFLAYVLDPEIQRYEKEILADLDKVDETNKDQLRGVLASYYSYINAMHWWLHVKYPWGLGVAFKKR